MSSVSLSPKSAPFLGVENLTVRFGGIAALDGVSFEIEQGTICGLIGPNGAGKTTLFNCLSRLYQPNSGKISFLGKDLLGMARHRIAPLGIGRTFQNLALFPAVSVRDNILIGGHWHTRGGFLASALRIPFVVKAEKQLQDETSRLLHLLDLHHIADVPVGELSFGTQKKVELGRALAAKPRLLLLDEPAAGLSHEEVEHLRRLIVSIRDDMKISVLLVEHHLNLVMRVSDKVVALNFGRKIADGPPAEVQENQEVVKAYLGDEK